MKDICLDCGNTEDSKLWPTCPLCTGTMVHQKKCKVCDLAVVGYVIDDDYCGPDLVVCSTCIEKIVKI